MASLAYLETLAHHAPVGSTTRPGLYARNARVIVSDSSAVDQASSMRTKFFDVRGGTKHPNTTMGDVRVIAAHWTFTLLLAPEPKFDRDRSERKRWSTELAHIDTASKRMPTTALYPRNAEFWYAVRRLAQYLSSYSVRPKPFDLAVEALTETVAERVEDVKDLANIGKGYLMPLLMIGAGVVLIPIAFRMFDTN